MGMDRSGACDSCGLRWRERVAGELCPVCTIRSRIADLEAKLAASEARCAELDAFVNTTQSRLCAVIEARDASLAAALARAEEAERVKGALIALLKRTYKAAMKPDWEEGECLNEVLGDVHWEMERPDREAAMERDLRQAMGD